jgi:uridine kinase
MRVTGSIKQDKKPFILGVAGGSGSGKTYFAKALLKQLGPEACEIVYQDNFYFDQSSRFDYDGGSVNFDHPSSIDFNFLAACLTELKTGAPTKIPIYDFVTHSRKKETILIYPKPVIIVDGILIFHAENVRKQFDDLVFFDTPETLRFSRRLDRDVKERGRTPDGVRQQFFKQVKPMHDEFVEPSKHFCSTIVREVGEFDGVLEAYTKNLLNRI